MRYSVFQIITYRNRCSLAKFS